jgi:2-polyprenyl-3-methyl-5-hydroxy-6-metoxy-1,4-benzoquinol methylase
LDYGCGPGYLADSVSDLTKSYYGVDISKNYIDTCVAKFKEQQSFHFFSLDETADVYTLEELDLPKHYFDTIIILSVVQYLDTKEKVSALVQSFLPFLKLKGEIILADVIDAEKYFLKDLCNICIYSIRNGYFVQFVKFVFQLKFSSYNKLRLKNSLLTITQADIEEICIHLNLQYTVLHACTLQSNRKTYLIRF